MYNVVKDGLLPYPTVPCKQIINAYQWIDDSLPYLIFYPSH